MAARISFAKAITSPPNRHRKPWDRNPWVNANGTQLELVGINYGMSADRLDHIGEDFQRQNCSAGVWFELSPGMGYFAVSFRFKDGSDNHIVMRYCEKETV